MNPSTPTWTEIRSSGVGWAKRTSTHWPTGSVKGDDCQYVSDSPSTAAYGPSSGRTGPRVSA